MKVRPSVKPMCEKCKVIKRKGVISSYVSDEQFNRLIDKLNK